MFDFLSSYQLDYEISYVIDEGTTGLEFLLPSTNNQGIKLNIGWVGKIVSITKGKSC